LDDGLIVVAQSQTKGRGQMGSTWESRPSQGLTFSMFKRFDNLAIEDQFYITIAVSLGVKKALEECNIQGIKIKWPNDILSYSKKLVGILVENSILAGKVSTSVIGLGINVNETEFKQLPSATSMCLSTGVTFNLDEVLTVVASHVHEQLERIEGGDLLNLKEAYETALFKKGEVSVFENTNGRRFNGIVVGVNPIGELLLEIENGFLESYQLKELKMHY